MDPISLGSNKKCAEVIHVRSPYSFWVRLDDYKNDYRAMLAQLQLDYADSKDTENEPDSLNAQNVTLGSFYCAFNQQLFEWHRCEALAINKSLDSIHIHYIDLGTTDLIPFRCLKHLRDNYKTISKFAIQCSLWQIKPVDSSQEWPTSTTNTFSKLVLNKTCTLTVKRKREQIYDIELAITNISVSEQLIKERCAILDDNAEVRLIQERLNSIIPVQVDRFKHKKLEINLGVEYLVAVPFITSPYCFYAQITGDVFNEFLEFEKELQTYYDDVRLRSEFVLLKKPQLGQMCVAKYAEDNQWYRALIKDISESQKHVRVFFVDYGNEEVMQVDGNLLLINEQFKLFPFMAVRCCLDGVKPSTQAVDLQMSEVADFMYETMPEQVLAVFVRKSAMGEFYMVNIKAGEESLSKLLIDKNYALPNVSGSSPKAATVVAASKQRPASLEVPKPKDYTKKVYPNGELKMEIGRTYEVIVTNVETVNEFYVKLADPATNEKLRKLEQDMNYFYNRKQNLPQPGIRVGEACVFSDYETKSWLRAKIVKIVDKDHCLVILIDSGVMRYVNRSALKEIYDKFLVEPCSIARACLNDLDEMVDEEIDEKLQQRFKDIVSKKKFLVKVVHTKQIDTTIDVDNVDKDDAADMIMTKYALNLFDIELEEGVYKMLVEDMDTSKFSDSFDVNYPFKPRIKSALEETRLNDTLTNAALNETMTSKQPVHVAPTVAHTVVPPTINDSFKQQAQKFTKPVNTGRDVLDSITSPFPVHQENLTNMTNVARTNGTLNGDGHKYAKPADTIQHQTAINQQQPKAAVQPEIIKKPEIPAPAVIPKAAAEPVIEKVAKVSAEPAVEKIAKVAPETKIETLPIPSKQPEVHQPPAQAAPVVTEQKPPLFYYPATDLPALFKSRPQPITIFHFESLTNFCAQLIDEYAFLEERLNDFESVCDSILANNFVLRLEDVATTNLALAAKFLDDNMWYRARIIPGTLSEDKKSVKVEFIDFGNSQVTPLESIVYLPKEYAAYKPSAVRCCGVGYIDPKLDPARLESLLLNGVQSEPMVWQAARFIAAPDSFSSSSSSVLVVIDELLKLIKNVCAKPSDEYFFDPNLYGEPISKPIHLAIDRTVDVRFSSFTAGLKYVYFHIKSMISGLEQLEKDLATETNDSLVSIDLNSSYDQLKLNHIYLIRHENKLRRASLIAIASKQRTLLFELVDYGTRVELISTTNDMAVYVLMPVYFQHPIYAVHCRLQFADSIERQVSKEERPKLMRQVQLAQRIRVIDLPGDINVAQPFVIELLDPSTNAIDATLAQTTARLLSKGILEIESQEIVRGSKVASLGDNKFCLIGNWLYSKMPQSDEIFKDISEKKFPITTADLWTKFKKFQESLNQHMMSSNCEMVSSAKKGSILLAKTTSEELISSLKEPYQTLIRTSWSRVRIDLFPKTNRPIDFQTDAISGEMRITYIDYGIKHKIEFTSDAEMRSMTFVDYELIEMPVKFKMCPAFNFLVRLNRNDVERKLTEANSRNEFFDPAYLLTTLDSLHSTLADLKFQVDFSYALTNPSSSNDQAVYVADLMTHGENFIDYCIRNGLNRIQKHEFPCFIVHINSSSDFYVQKSDDQTQSLLNNLQINIQAKNASAKLNPLRSLEIGKLCIAPFDQGLYRARIISYGGNNLRNLNSLHEDLLVDVFYIDYGNSHQLKLKDLREITPDLVDRLPRGFAIRCALDLQPSSAFDEFLFELIERERLAVKCKSRDDSGVYVVDFIDPDTKDTFIDMYKKKISATDMTTADEDHAISETIGGGGDTVDQSYFNETSINTSVRGQLAEVFDTKRQFPVSIDTEPHAHHKVVDEKGDANYSESTLPDLSLNEKPNLNQTNTTEWNVTDPNLRNYDYYEPTKMDDTMANSVVNQTSDQTDQNQASQITDLDKTPIADKTPTADKTPNGELYETVNETPTKSEEPQTVVAPTKQTSLLTRPAKIDMITIKNCLVSFMHSSEDFFIQMIDVDERLAKIQPEIDECLDPFVLEESSLCVTQYRVDEQFYRGRVLKWEEDKGEALVLFIDFGNKEQCLIDSTTRLSDTLRTVKPLAINCKLKSPIAVNSTAYSQLQTLINEEIVFDVRIKRSDFERFFDASSLETCGEFKCECELVTPRGLVVTADTLSEPNLWEKMSVQQVTDLEERQNDFDEDIEFIRKIIGEIEFIKQEPQSFRDDAISCSQEAQKPSNGQRDEEDEDDDKSSGGRNTEQSSEKPPVEQSASNGDCSSGDNKPTSMSDGSGDPNKQALTIDVSENQSKTTSKTAKKTNEETSEEICPNPEEYFYKPNGANDAESYPDDEENTLNDLPDLSEISEYKEDVGYSKLGDQSSVYITDAVAYTRTAVNAKTGDINKSLLILKTEMERKSSNGDKSEDKLSAVIKGQKETTNKEEPAKEQSHPKNEEELNGDDEVFDESVKEDESIIDNSQMHPKNITVDTPLGETSVWHSEKSRIEIEAKEKEIVKENTANIEKKVIPIPIEEPKPVDKKRKKPTASAEDTCLDQDSKWEDSIAVSSTANESRTNKSVKNTSILNESAMRHGHNETVNRSRFDASQAWDRSLNGLDDTRMNHPHNETVNRSRFDASKTWERSALADETTFMNHPHNETVNRSRFDASRTWEGAGLADDTCMNHPHNETVNRSKFDASQTWDRSVLEGAADDTIMNHPHNKTVSPSKFNKTAEWKADKSLQNGETGEAEEIDEQNTTMIENSSRSVNYLARTINPGDRANESTWSPDNTVIDTSAKKPNNNSIGYQRVLLGYCVNVEKGLDEFYFRLQDADQQLKSIIPTSESELRPLDKLPQCGEIFLARTQKKQLCRAQILSCDNPNETFSLLLIDYGLITSVKNSDLFKIDREIKYLPPLALQCRLHLSKEIEHLKVKLSESKRNAADWLNERFRDLVAPNKLVTLKQVKELNLSTQKPEHQHKICVDLFVNNGKENLCDLLLMEAVNELSRENKIDIKQHQQPSHSISDMFDCRVLEVAFVANNLQIQLKLQNESVIRKLDSIISSIENMSTLSENDEITPHHSSYLAPLPDHIWANYSYKSHGLKLRKNLARVKIAEKVLNEQLVKVEYEDFGCEATIPITSLSLINRHFEHIQSAIEVMYLDLDDGEKLPELSEAARKELREILEEICGLASFKAVLVVNESKHKHRSVTSHSSSSSNNVIRYVKLIDTHRESLDVGKLIDWCLNLMQSPPHSFRGYLTHLDGDFVRFDCLSELSHQSEYILELKKLYRAEMKREEALETLTYKIGELCLIDCSSSRSKRGAKKPDFTKCESLLSLNEPSAILADETANATAVDEESGEGKADLSRGIIIDISIDKCVLLNVDDGKKLTVSKKRLFECTKLIYKLPLMLITAKLTHEVDESTQKQLNQSRFYGEPITLTVLGAQNDQKALSSHERRLYKLVQMPWHQGEKTEDKKDENSVETEPLYYKLCYVKSLTHFYIHTSETMKRLREIEEELEAEHARSKKRPSNTVLVLKKGHVYGNYSSDEKKYYRVRMTDTDEMFFIDYGFMKSSIDKQQHLFEISDWLAQMAPEARCCRLSGFQERETFGELTNTARTNELRTRSQLDLFRRLLEGKPFLASLSQLFAQSNKRISNYIPAQCDNTQPVEIVIHLLNDVADHSGGSEDENNTHSEMKAMLNSSRSAFLDEINTASGDEKTSGSENTRNLTNILKQITATVNNPSGSSAANRRASVPSSNAFGIISRPLKHVDLFADSYTVAHVEVVNIVSPTEFYIRKPNWEILYNQLGEQMRRDLGKSTSGHNVREKDLLQPGLICAYVNRAEETFKRAMVVASNLKNSKHLQVKLFLVDSGKFLTTTDSNLYYFENEQYFNVEPLCFMCSLKLDPAVSISNDLIAKFRKLVSLHKNFRLECVEAAPLASHLPGGFVKYQVEMFTYVNAASSLNQQLNQLSQSNMLDMTSICDSDIFFEPQIEGETQELRESMLPVNQELKAQLTNVDSIRLFGIVLSSQANKRAEFIRSFHAWHREERASLKPLLTNTDNVSPDDLVGRICTVHSVMQAQWSRAIVLSCDFSARTASIYLVDYCKTVGTMIDRLYKLEKPEFLSEPVYAHRCQLEDEPEQRERFSKYLDILKTYHVSGFAPTAVIGGLTAAPNSPIPSSQQQPQSHIAIENYELTIDCKHKQVSSVDYESNRVRTWLSTVRINDIKRIVSPFKGSPHSILSAKSSRASLIKRQQQQQAAADSFSSMSATMLTATSATNGCAMALGSAGLDESSMMLENVENVLKISDNSTTMSRTAHDYDRVTTNSYVSSSNQPPVFNINASSINTPMSYKNANINGVDGNIDNNNDPEESITINAGTSSSNSNEKATNSNSNNQNVTATNDTFSAVTESTRIQNTTSATVDDPLNDFDGDMTTTIMQQQQQSGSKSPQPQKSRTATSRRASDFEEPLVVVSESPCVAALDADQSNDLIACLNDLEVGGPPIRVFLVASELNMNEFVCLKADLHASFERLQAAMNLHYEKISRASKSLEKDDFNPLSYDAEENGLSDSLGDGEGHKIATSQSLISDPFAHSFKQGEFAAACLNKKWSRCLILDMDRKRAQVECLDDCSTHMVHLSKLEKLLPVFKKLPRFAFRCKLNGWSTEKLMRFDHKRFTEFKDSLIHHESSLTYCAQVEIIEYKECNFSTLYECRLFLNGIDFIDYFQRK